MPTVSPGNKTLLRASGHVVTPYMSVHRPLVIWTADVVGVVERESETIPFNNGSGLSFPLIGKHQTVIVYHSDGQPPEKLRVKAVTSGDGGVTGNLICNGNGTYWTGGETLEFQLTYDVWGIFPFVSGDPGNPDFTKDWDADGGIHYTDENELINPVAIAGPHRAGFLGSNGEISFFVPVGSSYPVADGATIVSKSVSVYPLTGWAAAPEIDGMVEIVYDEPGQYIVTTIVEDSNGKIQETYRVHFVHVNDPASEHYPLCGFDAMTVTGDWNQGGWTAAVRFHRDVNFEAIPDESLVVLWQDAWYGDEHMGISGIEIAPELIMAGYTRDDRFNVNLADGGSADFNIASINALLESRMMFSISLESRDDPSDWWQYKNGQLTPSRIVHHILRWHTTVMHVSDVFGITTNQDQRKAMDIDKATVYQMANQTVADYGIIARLVSDKAGRLHISEDITIEEDAYRASLPIVSDILKSETSGEIVIPHTPVKQAAFVFFSGFNYNGETATPLGSTAPSKWPSQFGPGEIMVERQVVRDQEQSNQMAGQIYAKHNNPYKEVRVTFNRNYLGILEPAFEEWWEISLDSADTIRGLVWVNKKIVCRQVVAKYDIGKGLVSIDVVYEPEPDGVPGVPYQWPTEVPEVGGAIPDIYDGDWEPGDPFPPGVGEILITGASIWRRVGSQAWVEEYEPIVQDVDVDQNFANWPNPLEKQLYACGVGEILISGNGGQSWGDLGGIPNPPNTWGDTPAPVLAEVVFEQYETDVTQDGAHWFLANWQNPVSGAWRSWLFYYTSAGEEVMEWYPVGETDPPSGVEGWGLAFQVPGHGAVLPLSGGRHLITFRDQSTLNVSHMIRLGADDYTTPISHGFSASIIRTSCVDDKFILHSANNIYIGEVDVSNNVTLGSAVAIPAITRGTGGTIADIQILGPTRAVIVHSYSTSVGSNPPDNKGFGVAVVTISGLAASIGAWAYTETDKDILYSTISVAPGSETEAIVAYSERTPGGEFFGLGPLCAKVANASGATATFPSAKVQISETVPENLKIARNDASGAYTIAARTKAPGYGTGEVDIHFYALSYDGTITPGAEFLIGEYVTGTNLVLDIQYAGGDRADFAYRYSGTHIVAIRTGGSALDRSVTHLCEVPSQGGPHSVVAGEAMLLQSASSISYPLYFCATTATDGMSLGFDIDKFDGSRIYLTLYDNSFNISLQTYSTSTGELLDNNFIAESVDSEIATRRRWAYPFCPIGIDGVFIHGRFVIGGVPYQIVYTDDNGQTLSPIENGWVIDHCASMVQDRFGYIYAIRCSDKGAPLPPKIYELTESLDLVLKGTPTTLDYGINPRAVKPGFNGELYLAANSPNDIMVIKTVYPFNGAGENITANHQTVRGVKAIAVL